MTAVWEFDGAARGEYPSELDFGLCWADQLKGGADRWGVTIPCGLPAIGDLGLCRRHVKQICQPVADEPEPEKAQPDQN